MVVAPLGLVFVIAFAADEGFVHLDNTHQLTKFLVLQRRADAVANIPSGLVGAKTHMAMHLQGANAFLSTEHQVDDLEPISQVYFGILENGPNKVREAISAPSRQSGHSHLNFIVASG